MAGSNCPARPIWPSSDLLRFVSIVQPLPTGPVITTSGLAAVTSGLSVLVLRDVVCLFVVVCWFQKGVFTMLLQMLSLLKTYIAALDQEEGQGMVEYALIIALVAVVVAAMIPGVTSAISGVFSSIATSLGGG